jgi:glyoxylase-like metal-dependent hydrolase (beta-lactamase superfamily II)
MAMIQASSYSFQLGDFHCWIISDGRCSSPEKAADPAANDDAGDIDNAILLVRTGRNTILFDTGWGVGAEAAPWAGLLVKNLEAAGIGRAEIDTIVFSHGHPDHIGGNTDDRGNLVFPNARYYMFNREWEFWTMKPDLTSLPENIRENVRLFIHEKLLPLRDRMNLFDGSGDIVPGISCIPTPGHTPGHVVLVVSSGNQRLLCLFDVFHRPKEIETTSLFLTSPMTGEAAASREKILSQIRPGDLVYAGHFPFPGLGHVRRQDKSWRWQPLQGL